MQVIKEIAVGTAFAVGLTGCTVQPQEPSPQSSHNAVVAAPQHSSEPLLPAQVCKSPSPHALKAAAALMDLQQTHPGFLHDTNSSDSVPQLWHEEENARQTAATQLGLHVIEPPREVYDWEISSDAALAAIPFPRLYGAAKSYLERFGVTLEIGRSSSDPDYSSGSRIPSKGDLNTLNAKKTILSLFTEYEPLPTEYTHLAGLKKVALVTGTSDGTVAYAVLGQGMYFMDIASGGTPDNNRHEIEHLVDANECGVNAVDNDPAFEAPTKNLKGYYGYSGPFSDRYPSLDNGKYQSALFAIIGRMTDAENANSKAGYCQAVAAERKLDAGVKAVSEYHPNPAEAKAEIGKTITDPLVSWEVTSPTYPALFAQARVWLARLYENVPALARYFTAIGSGASKDDAYSCR